jgi:flagellum-specific ATP synthase
VRSHAIQQRLRAVDPILRIGHVLGIQGPWIEADGPNAPLGTLCRIEPFDAEAEALYAEIIRVAPGQVVLSPFDTHANIVVGARITAVESIKQVGVGRNYLGRAIDALGQPLDAGGDIVPDAWAPLQGVRINPLRRRSPSAMLATGVRAIDGLLTLGQGQRIGVFAASGVGKTTLMRSIADAADVDIVIYCLVGERGREVEALWNEGLSDAARERATLVAATSDQSAAMRVRACHYALALAEYWRDQGKHVLLLLDSVTRLAMAMREIGLAAGEPPTIRAYTPGVFAAIPQLVERCGALSGSGAISAIMTVLSETDDIDDPVSEMMKSLLDGHILLAREIAERGQYPAIDISRSISRQAEGLVSPEQREHIQTVREWLSIWEQSRMLIDSGLYKAGTNRVLDHAIERQDDIRFFLTQSSMERADRQTVLAGLAKLAGKGGRHVTT